MPLGGNLRAYLNRYAPILKHKSFEEEREWRIVTRPIMCTRDLFGYRVGTSMVIPYFRMPLGKNPAIREVVIGPTPHPEQSRHSVTGFLVKHNIDAKVRTSEVPYRNW